MFGSSAAMLLSDAMHTGSFVVIDVVIGDCN